MGESGAGGRGDLAGINEGCNDDRLYCSLCDVRQLAVVTLEDEPSFVGSEHARAFGVVAMKDEDGTRLVVVGESYTRLGAIGAEKGVAAEGEEDAVGENSVVARRSRFGGLGEGIAGGESSGGESDGHGTVTREIGKAAAKSTKGSVLGPIWNGCCTSCSEMQTAREQQRVAQSCETHLEQ